MQLLFSLASPYARTVRVVIAQFAIRGIEPVAVNPLENTELLLDANPLAKIPCLLLNDGGTLYDSEVILRYLDHEYCGGELFGQPGDSWYGETQYSLIKGLLDSAVALRQEQMRDDEGLRSPFWTARFEQALLRGLAQIELMAIYGHSKVSLQQICLACLLEYIDFRHPDLDWRKVAPATARWLQTFSKSAAMLTTRPHV
ncbi:glutathione S-transferase N-terminal domain-containing protein [Shewanella halotolerans]|uniref:glutathione S-transferase N-terminal domain-containing protein n=1 Tax=Shewanella halotolerans TaxID=2864204 RepID=UPI001C65A85A|nr:glutathione S-transferase N-terminal domain-containing protein [Shewanella halotolerans]QYJ89221.1 glutathione S-transferase N-terminal domain-containing protein [Shewanella halotolerans]